MQAEYILLLLFHILGVHNIYHIYIHFLTSYWSVKWN